MTPRLTILAVLVGALSLTLVVTAAAAQGTDEVKWISTLRELGGWGVAGLAIYFLNQSIEKERKEREERDKFAEKREQATLAREALVIGALQESARVGERLAGAVGGLTDLIRDRREALDHVLERALTEVGHMHHDTRVLLSGQEAQGRRITTLIDAVAACRAIVETMEKRARKEPA